MNSRLRDLLFFQSLAKSRGEEPRLDGLAAERKTAEWKSTLGAHRDAATGKRQS